MDTKAGQEVMGGQVLERCEPRADRAHVRVRTIERGDRFPQTEVAPRPRLRPREMAGEEPLSRPLADPALGDELCLHVVVGQERETPEVELAPRESDDVLGLPPREAEPDELLLLHEGEPLARRERVRVAGALAERGDQPVPDREGGEERDLLRADRRDEGLERVGSEWRTEPSERRNEPREHGLGGRERSEAVEIELEAEQLAHDGLGLGVERLDVDTAVGRRYPHLASVDDAVEAAVVPEVREIGPERAVPLGRERKVVRLRDAEERHAPTVEKRVRTR